MKKTVEIIGLSHNVGENAKGKYDFYLLHAIGYDDKVEGREAICASLPDYDVPFVKIGDIVDIHVRWYNGKASVAYFPHN